MKTKKEKINLLKKKGFTNKEIAELIGTQHQYVRQVIQQTKKVGLKAILKRKKKIQKLFEEGKTVSEVIQLVDDNHTFIYDQYMIFKKRPMLFKTSINPKFVTEYTYEEVKNELPEHKQISTDFSNPEFVETIRKRWRNTCGISAMANIHNQSK